jgi:hypothetical protein
MVGELAPAHLVPMPSGVEAAEPLGNREVSQHGLDGEPRRLPLSCPR